MSEYELKPQELKCCPFCGGRGLVGGCKELRNFVVVCTCCGASSNECAKSTIAVKNWNTRAGGK